MATANKVPLKTLKDCFQFLEWLKSNGDMQTQVASELETRLRDKYNGVNGKQIENSLSQFLQLVSKFYKKLVTDEVLQKAQSTTNKKYNRSVTLVVFKALLECIPKVLSACYFLQYHVDGNFKTLGGGEWAGDMVGRIAQSGSGLGKIYSYLLIKSSNSYRVIPGGFVQGELNEGDQNGGNQNGGDQNGYKHGNVMADDLGKILEQRKDNLFLDVFVTSVSSTAGTQASNTANVLALLKHFCEIVQNDLDDKLKKYLGSHNVCVNWDKLTPHCADLKTQLDKLFANDRFSQTGQLPTLYKLNKEEFVKKMARWLKDNLDKVRGKLHNINKYSHMLDSINTDKVGDYLNKHFFPYGFTFDAKDFGKDNLCQVLKDDWKGVIEMLDGHDTGLAKLVDILKDMKCTQNQDQTADLEDDDEEEDYEEVVLEDEDESVISSNQNDGQSGQNPESSQEVIGSETPPEDGKGQGPTGSPGDAGKSLQVGGPPAQQPVPPPAAPTSSTITPRPGSSSSGGLAPGSGQQTPMVELGVSIPSWQNSENAHKLSDYALSDDDFERLLYPNGVNLGKGPLIDPKTFGKAHPQSGIVSYNEKPEETSEKLSKSLGLHNTYEPLKPLDFTFTPYYEIAGDPYSPQCRNPWYIHNLSTDPASATLSHIPDSDHLPPPKTVREMLYWLVGLNQHGYIRWVTECIKSLIEEYNTDAPQSPYAIDIAGDLTKLDASMVTRTLTEASLYAANVLYTVKYRDYYTVYNDFKFESEYSKFRYSSDPISLLCQLRDYAYAGHYQLQFLKTQCARDKLSGGWMGCHFGQDVAADSPLQAFLTDAYDSMFKTHLFDPCNICLKSRVKMGFKHKDLPKPSQTGNTLFTVLSPSCGDDDPLLTLSSYLNCLTRRTPRTTGELVSFFHNFGVELHDDYQKALSSLGSSLSTPHPNCPEWDCLRGTDLQAVRGIRGTDAFNTIHDNAHPNSLSTLFGCDITNVQCTKLLSPITYRAYSLYSPTFAHTYLIWAVYLPDRLWESLKKLRYDLEGHGNTKCASLHSCPYAMPLLYLHGFTPPEGTPQTSLTCSELITKLGEVVNGGPMAKLMTCMDQFLYRVRKPFIYTLIALWSAAALLLSYTILYRLDVLYLCSHAIRSKASHLIDVKALLTNSRKMLSLYDADYFDDDPNDLVDQLE
ncbi:hypothetical protein BBBOND_0300710 [Babesia bigemina]|uniref:Ribosome binding protein n=1 Tax=Babesia bigemina TaxID=5866 RepID=A0A061D637_BABBI|nr:hypothetical protein BBBOND_0300710 [Babesia bigemina]CDR96166.1 hypothetical protein BBBOND_0300710 [Babesia bigemina]|eukprot:XP_012768352.1 hypothetical protein BBBOND_0300710 [Babesia bigemina]